MIPEIVVITGSLLIFIALISIVVPIIPGGPILSYISILLWYLLVPNKISNLPSDEESFTITITLLIVLGSIHLLSLISDFILPIIGSKVFKLSSSGVWGAFIGIFIGLFFFPPIGVITGGIIGTFIGELYHRKALNFSSISYSLKATGYATLLNIAMFLFKIVLTMITTYYFISAVWDYYF